MARSAGPGRRKLGEWFAAGFDEVAARKWLAAGVSPALASEFRLYGFSTDDGVEWAALRFAPAEASAWRVGGIPAAMAARWKAGGFADPVSSLEYQRSGFSPEDAAMWQRWLGEVVEGVWDEPEVTARLAVAWRAAGFAPKEAAIWLGTMVRSARPGGWDVTRVSDGYLVAVRDLFAEAEIAIPQEAAWSRAIGLSPEEAAACRMGGWLPPVDRLRDMVPSGAEAARWRDVARALVERRAVSPAGAEVAWLLQALSGVTSLGGGRELDWLALPDRRRRPPDVAVN
jgi:hypothetical protein